jgi:small-conductance mechanosensitive channel
MEKFLEGIDITLVSFGENQLTVLLLVKIVGLTFLIYIFSRILRVVFYDYVFAKLQPNEGIRFAIARIILFCSFFSRS